MARVTAVSNTRWEQIDFDTRVVSDVVEKEGYIVDLYFSEEVKSYLLDLRHYREDRKIDDSGYVFAAYSAGEYNKAVVATLNQWCKRVGELIGVPTLHPHDFRHSGATLLKNSGMNLEDVSKLLNHKGTDVTSKSVSYTHLDVYKRQAILHDLPLSGTAQPVPYVSAQR